MSTICRRCGTYCYGDCTASGGSRRAVQYAPVESESTPREMAERELAQLCRKLVNHTDPDARAYCKRRIAELRATLAD